MAIVDWQTKIGPPRAFEFPVKREGHCSFGQQQRLQRHAAKAAVKVVRIMWVHFPVDIGGYVLPNGCGPVAIPEGSISH